MKPKKRRKVGSKNKNKKLTKMFLKNHLQKKSRKPKENIIKNENPVFNNSTSDNLIIRLKVNVKHDNIDSFDNKNFNK